MFNFNDMLKNSQEFTKMLKQLEEAKGQKIFDISVGAGAVKIKVNGNLECLAVEIDKELLNPEELGTLQDLLQAAISEIGTKIKAESSGDFLEQLKKFMPYSK